MISLVISSSPLRCQRGASADSEKYCIVVYVTTMRTCPHIGHIFFIFYISFYKIKLNLRKCLNYKFSYLEIVKILHLSRSKICSNFKFIQIFKFI
jgi:ABC-type arginine transport system permease subunit